MEQQLSKLTANAFSSKDKFNKPISALQVTKNIEEVRKAIGLDKESVVVLNVAWVWGQLF